MFRSFTSTGQHILNLIGGVAERANERRRFSALPFRYLEDAGMTLGDAISAGYDFDPIDFRHPPATLVHSV